MSYTASKAQSGSGTKLYVGSPAVLIGEVVSATLDGKNMFDDTTNMDSSAKEFLPTLPDPGKVVVELNRVSTDVGQAALQASKDARTRLNYSMVLPVNTVAGQATTGDTYAWLAYVEDFQPEIRTDKKIPAKLSLQRTGATTYTQGS